MNEENEAEGAPTVRVLCDVCERQLPVSKYEAPEGACLRDWSFRYSEAVECYRIGYERQRMRTTAAEIAVRTWKSCTRQCASERDEARACARSWTENAGRAARLTTAAEARRDEMRSLLESALAAHKHDSGDQFCWCLKAWSAVGTEAA